MMNEAKRFFRYITPGLVFAVEFILILSVLRWDWVATHATLAVKDAALSAAVALFLVTGAIGFILSSVHHSIHWSEWSLFRRLAALNHVASIRWLVEQHEIELRSTSNGDGINAADIDRWVAWNVLTAVWHQTIGVSNSLRGAHKRADAFSDLLHGTGTARVAAFFATALAFIFAGTISSISLASAPVLRAVTGILIGGGLVAFHQTNYKSTAEFFQAYTDSVLIHVVTHRKDQRYPLVVYTAVRQTNGPSEADSAAPST
jgi:hypothetical protein